MTTPQTEADLPSPPTSRQLLRSTAIAIALALLILTTVVMPAEYGIDPTGAGQVLGLTRMGKIKLRLAREAAAADAEAKAEARAEEAAAPPQPATPR